MKPTILNISDRLRNTEYYDRTRDIETALAWSTIKKTLHDVERGELFSYIKSIRVTEKSIVVTTGKPIVNGEIKAYRELLLQRINTSFVSMKMAERQVIRLG